MTELSPPDPTKCADTTLMTQQLMGHVAPGETRQCARVFEAGEVCTGLARVTEAGKIRTDRCLMLEEALADLLGEAKAMLRLRPVQDPKPE